MHWQYLIPSVSCFSVHCSAFSLIQVKIIEWLYTHTRTHARTHTRTHAHTHTYTILSLLTITCFHFTGKLLTKDWTWAAAIRTQTSQHHCIGTSIPTQNLLDPSRIREFTYKYFFLITRNTGYGYLPPSSTRCDYGCYSSRCTCMLYSWRTWEYRMQQDILSSCNVALSVPACVCVILVK